MFKTKKIGAFPAQNVLQANHRFHFEYKRFLSIEILESRLSLSAAGICDWPAAAISGSPWTAGPVQASVSDNYFSTAQDLGLISSLLRVSDSVGGRDYSDFFRFDLPARSDLQVQLADLQANLDLRVYNSAQQPIGTSAQTSTTSESFTSELVAGTYFVRVFPARYSDVSPYRLEITAGLGNPARPPMDAPSPDVEPPATVLPPANDAGNEQVVAFPSVAYYGSGNDWSVNSINAPEVWAQGYSGGNVVVAVLDTGVDLDHVDLVSNIWTNIGESPGNGRDDDRNGYVDDVHGWDFAYDDNVPNDTNGHGTHVAGIIAAARNALGATGVAFDAAIMPVQVLASDGSGSIFDIAAGIRYAVDNGADIINLSLGLGPSRTISAALSYARQNDVLVVSAAGNDGRSTPDYPARYSANYSNVISVGAYGSSHSIASFSNVVGRSGAVQVDAPGVSVYSTVHNNGYARFSGTSMAAPQVAGLAALALSADPTLTAAQLRNLLVSGADRSISRSDAEGGVNAALTVAMAAAEGLQS